MRLTLATLLSAATLAFAAPAMAEPTNLADLSDTDRAALHEEIRSYLLENPEVIFDAIQILEQRRTMAAQQAEVQLVRDNAAQLFDDGFSWVGGNPEGDVTIVEFLDYRCGFCKKAHPEIVELLERDPNVRLVVKEFPILGPDSVIAARMALAAADLDADKFAALNDALLGYAGNLTEQVAYRLASEAGYDIAALKERAASDTIEERLQQNYQLAQRLGLQGTPAFVVGTEVIRGYLPADDMLAAVAAARAASN